MALSTSTFGNRAVKNNTQNMRLQHKSHDIPIPVTNNPNPIKSQSFASKSNHSQLKSNPESQPITDHLAAVKQQFHGEEHEKLCSFDITSDIVSASLYEQSAHVTGVSPGPSVCPHM